MIQLQNITHLFNKGQSNEVKAINGLSLEIPESEFVVLIGSNGSGKSTLLNLIAGTDIATQGNLKISGIDLSHAPNYKRSRWVSRVFQNPTDGTAADLSIVENFRLAALRNQKISLKIGLNQKFEQEVQEKIATLGLGLENKIHQSMGSLSGGQRQALCLLMAVWSDLKVLLLDEPTAALDPKSAEIVMQIANQLIRENNITTVMVTHQLKDAIQYGDRIIHMQEGKIAHDFSKSKTSTIEISDLYNLFS
ncbi:MAG TPA: ATP-binding cassette domain-containing protein [Chitinophagales bacterium]|nr:ATP-binding cassette domain-containing protein [Chitinophagales bacterium]